SIPSVFSLPPLPANVELVPLTEDLVPGFKRLNALLLPIAYPTAFYTETMTEPHHGVTLMALWSAVPPGQSASPAPEKPRLIGAIRCRILPSANLYISTIGVLSPYRSYGIATHLLQWIVLKASEEHGVRSITAHVWEANEDGLDWYKKRGFDVIGKEDGYYRKLRPSGADVTYTITCLGPRCTDNPPTSILVPTTVPGGGQPRPTTTAKPPTPPKSSSAPKPTQPKPTSAPPPSKVRTQRSPPPTQKPTKTQGEEEGPSSTRCPVPLYYKCGGWDYDKPWAGCTTCVKGAKCVEQNEWYFQCVADE
ncbi:acyl-CoA N-acyltransferase, partial [Massariosphaeria phaeospora]